MLGKQGLVPKHGIRLRDQGTVEQGSPNSQISPRSGIRSPRSSQAGGSRAGTAGSQQVKTRRPDLEEMSSTAFNLAMRRLTRSNRYGRRWYVLLQEVGLDSCPAQYVGSTAGIKGPQDGDRSETQRGRASQVPGSALGDRVR